MDARVTHRRLAATALLLLALAACGQEQAPAPSPSTEPTPEGLAAALLTPEDLGEGWSTWVPEDQPEAESGVVTEEMQALIPRVDFCEKAPAEAQAAAQDLRWQAFRQLHLDTGAPTPEPGSTEPPRHHLVFVQEFLAEDDAAEATYDALVAGAEACEGFEETTQDGETVTTSALEVPTLGDESVGWRMLVVEPGPAARAATWDLRHVLVRDGEVLLVGMVAEIVSPTVETVVDDDRAFEVVGQMADKVAERS